MLLNLNAKTIEVDVDPQMPLLWVLRNALNMTGTKFDCGTDQRVKAAIHRAAGSSA